MHSRLDNDLMRCIDGGDAGVALDDALVGRPLRALVFRAIALAQPAGRAAAIRQMRRELLAQLLRILPQPRDPRRGLGGGLQPLGPLRELGPRPSRDFCQDTVLVFFQARDFGSPSNRGVVRIPWKPESVAEGRCRPSAIEEVELAGVSCYCLQLPRGLSFG